MTSGAWDENPLSEKGLREIFRKMDGVLEDVYESDG